MLEKLDIDGKDLSYNGIKLHLYTQLPPSGTTFSAPAPAPFELSTERSLITGRIRILEPTSSLMTLGRPCHFQVYRDPMTFSIIVL
ncbi:hypothetical protein PoB_000596200 [Plakobranchus ocellatus]|uniref:Uncharacterized protein n=1 Tax=Plakobranchus ocellatus TaxID=259542 RepID=A0AAV3Y9I5_9GAST|nr:hypothetical protein PoB_000596200 [Plakobranchus ocellatus]